MKEVKTSKKGRKKMKIYKVESYVKGNIFEDYIGNKREKAIAEMESVWGHWTRTEQMKNSVQVEEFELNIKNSANIDEIENALEELINSNSYGYDVVDERNWEKQNDE